MPLSIDPALETKIQNVQFLFERYIRNAGANCDVLGSLDGLLEGTGIDVPELGGFNQVSEIFGKIKDGVGDTIKQISQSTKFVQDKFSDLTSLVSEINLAESLLSPEEFEELQADFLQLQTTVSGFADEITLDLGPAIDSYFALEDSIAQSLDMIKSTNCPIINDALEFVAPGITPYLNNLSESIKNKSLIRDTVLKKTAAGAIGNITNKIQNITSKFQGRLNTIQNVNNSINRIRQKLQGFF